MSSDKKHEPTPAPVTLYTPPNAVKVAKSLGWPVSKRRMAQAIADGEIQIRVDTKRRMAQAIADGEIQIRVDTKRRDAHGQPRARIQHEDLIWWLKNVLWAYDQSRGAAK